MSISIHFNGRKRSDMKKTLHTHQVRTDEKTGRQAARNSESHIDPRLSHLNENYFDDSNRFKTMRDKLDKISERRVRDGKKKLYKSANVMLVGTIQLSDESLQKLGWRWDEHGNKLPADRQTPQAVKNVRLTYRDAIRSVKQQPDIYGDIYSATLHLDEGAPHIDLMSDPLDVDKPYQTARDFLNGPKGTKKGVALRNMQDNIMRFSRFDAKTRNQFGLTRGDSQTGKIDKVRTIREDTQKIKQTSEELQGRVKTYNARASKLREAAVQLKQYGDALKEREHKVAERERTLESREKAADEREHKLRAQTTKTALKDAEATRKINTALKLQANVQKKDAEATKKLNDATKLQELARKTIEQAKKAKQEVESIKNRLSASWQRVLDMVRHGDLAPRKVEETVKPYNPITTEKMEPLALDLDELSKSVSKNNDMQL